MLLTKKSQAALEFIMTYGWAILVVLVAIGALSYFGVLSPDRFLPSRCIIGSGITCLDHAFSTAGITAHIRSNIGYTITIDRVTASNCGNAGEAPILLLNDGEETFSIPCTLTSNSRYSGDINVTYTNSETNIQHVKKGTVTGKVS